MHNESSQKPLYTAWTIDGSKVRNLEIQQKRLVPRQKNIRFSYSTRSCTTWRTANSSSGATIVNVQATVYAVDLLVYRYTTNARWWKQNRGYPYALHWIGSWDQKVQNAKRNTKTITLTLGLFCEVLPSVL